MMLPSLLQQDLTGKCCVLREDLNVPISGDAIENDTRVRRALPAIQHIVQAGGSAIILSHLGRPVEGEYDSAFSLEPVAARLSELLCQPVRFERDWLNGVTIQPGEVVLCENVRFCVGEADNHPELAAKMAELGDIVVMDAFATSHRANASTEGIIHHAKAMCIGPLMQAELTALEQAMSKPSRPVLGIVGGAKVSTKLALIENLLDVLDVLIVGGGIANTFLVASGVDVGCSLVEPDMVEAAQSALALSAQRQCRIVYPSDVVVAPAITSTDTSVKPCHALTDRDAIFDIGPQTIAQYLACVRQARTIVWNGPVGVFENSAFAAGTRALAHAIAEHDAFSIAGGGDTISAIDTYQLADKISYISTGGGAFLAYLEGQPLATVAALYKRFEQQPEPV